MGLKQTLKEIYYIVADKRLLYFSLSLGISTFAYSLLTYYFPIIMTNLDITTFTIGIIYSIISFLYVVFNIPLGAIVDKIGSKNAVTLSALMAVPLFLLMGTLNPLLFIISLVIFESVIRIVNSLGAHRFMLNYTNAGKAFGVFSLITSILAAIGIMLGGYLLQHSVSTLLFTIIAVLFGISGIIRFLELPKDENKVEVKRSLRLGFKYLKEDKKLLLYLLVSILSSGLSLETYYVTIYFVKDLLLPLTFVGVLYSSYALIMAFLPLLFSVILSKRSNFKNLSILIFSNSVIFFLVPLFTNVYILFLLFYAWTVIVAMESIVDYNVAQSVTKPEIRGTQVALISTFVRIFSVFYNAIVGLLFQITPLYSFYFTGFLGILAIFTIKFAEFIGVLK
ncbi:MFS transporter [Saccharolobus solfataricus]|uniref:Multidrug resistance related protein n=3 Tax=Saccharolobus solfataricus TaxID=2287 RepID=Q7LXV2_SACS2|nr:MULTISPECIES: MFS transporter [Sulfolobaceae]AAK40865.1 Multidrug resistance related protein [Saccharolobus solfataricus P2]AKA73874.1 MFS transporter [Saccharolobus solfataricus]AKA76573.1 MFS transporter [Saccharolobus solfataricus]AKA79265.1 MFS transporter [Saccharolobus solfataricus]AZF68352.1 MFS transporter [Saccharolobus solfataricus]